MAIIGLRWDSPFSTFTELPSIDITKSSHTEAITSDGTTIFGFSTDSSNNPLAVKWVGTSLTQLFAIDSNPSKATFCNPSGDVIIGGAGYSSPSFTGGQGAMWISGGTAGAIFTLPVGGTSVPASFVRRSLGGQMGQRICSDDGTIVVGTVTRSPGFTPVVWTNGIPAILPFPLSDTQGHAFGCNADGSVIFGETAGFGTQHPVYWSSGVVTVLNSGLDLPLTYECLADGSVIYGRKGPIGGDAFTPDTGYWDTLGTPGGVFHLLDALAGSSRYDFGIVACCPILLSGLPVACGIAVDASSRLRAVRWHGTTAEVLADVIGSSQIGVTGISDDGTIVTGWAQFFTPTQEPVFWDSGGAVTVLPTPASLPDTYLGQAWGITPSSAGTIFGDADTATIVSSNRPYVIRPVKHR